nr:uncharacterized protein LOC109162592 [Ipomoea batatas]
MRRFIQQAAQIHNLAAGDKLPELFRRRFIARVSAAVLRHNHHPSPHRTTAALNLRRRRGRAAQPEKLRAAPRPPRPHRGSHGRVGGAFHAPASSVLTFFLFHQSNTSFETLEAIRISDRVLAFSSKNNRSDSYPYYSSPQPGRGGGASAPSSSTTSVHVTALDGLVNVNSLFTVAVFVGLSLATPGQKSLEERSNCDAGIDVVKKLLVFEVVSFSFFLFSSLVAQGLKLAINLLNSKDADEAFRAHVNAKVLRLGMVGSAIGSVMGCLFLMLSMVNVIEIRLGMLSCGSKSAVHTVAVLVILVTSALLVYISTVIYAFLH